ncbi:MAG: hypothetical protein LUM44_09685 [Pyrinomonadaceae bacterium]|nr:hypothetical protein [Pyrinomonadaceae bacterium]
MASSTSTLAPSNSSDANFRLWGKAISDAFAAGGWVKQENNINWGSVTAPGAAATVTGYEIWRSNDGTNQIYVKIEYGSGVSSASNPAISFQVGWGSDGAGNLTGFTSTKQTTFTSSNSNSATAYNCNFHAAAGSVCIFMWTNWGGIGTTAFSVERTRDASNNKQDEVLIFYGNAGGSNNNQILNRTSGVFPAETGGKLAVNSSNAISSGNIGLGLLFGQKGGFVGPSQNIFGSTTANIGATQTTFTLESYGETHTYIVNSASGITFTSGVALITRFD